MRLRPRYSVLSASLALSMFSTGIAGAAMTASATTECLRFKGKELASCEIQQTNGRPIRRQVKAKAKKFIRAHVKLTKDAARVKSTSSAGTQQ